VIPIKRIIESGKCVFRISRKNEGKSLKQNTNNEDERASIRIFSGISVATKLQRATKTALSISSNDFIPPYCLVEVKNQTPLVVYRMEKGAEKLRRERLSPLCSQQIKFRYSVR